MDVLLRQDVWVTVCKYMTPASIAQVACSCRTLQKMASLDEVWMQHCPAEWRNFGVCPVAVATASAVDVHQYTSWRSLGIAAYTVPCVPPDHPEGELRSSAAALVAQGCVAQADFLLCKRCTSSDDSGVWMELCVLLTHVVQDTRRAGRALELFVEMTGRPLYQAGWDTRCAAAAHAGETAPGMLACVGQARCQAVVASFLLALASGLLGPAAAGDACHAVTLRHNEEARLECRKRAAWILSLKTIEERMPRGTVVSRADEDAAAGAAASCPSCSSDDDGSASDDADDDSDDMHHASSYVAAACARRAHLRQCAEAVAVDWMRAGKAVAAAAWGLSEASPASALTSSSGLLHALIDLCSVLLMVDREEDAVAAYEEAHCVAASMCDKAVVISSLSKAAGVVTLIESLCFKLMQENQYGKALAHLDLLFRCTLARLREEWGATDSADARCGRRGQRLQRLWRVCEAAGLCLLNTYQHAPASQVSPFVPGFACCWHICCLVKLMELMEERGEYRPSTSASISAARRRPAFASCCPRLNRARGFRAAQALCTMPSGRLW